MSQRTKMTGAVLGVIGMTSLLIAGPGETPKAVIEAFQSWRPNVPTVSIDAAVQYGEDSYYILSGEAVPQDGEAADSSFIEEGCFKMSGGRVTRINGTETCIPAENYVADPRLAQLLNSNYVARQISKLGRNVAAAKAWNRQRMSLSEAKAWQKEGVKLNPATLVFRKGDDKPFGTIGEVLRKGGQGQPDEGMKNPSPTNTPPREW